jgi:hypothetical protein
MVIDVSRMGDKNLGIQIAWDQKYEVDKKKKKNSKSCSKCYHVALNCNYASIRLLYFVMQALQRRNLLSFFSFCEQIVKTIMHVNFYLTVFDLLF